MRQNQEWQKILINQLLMFIGMLEELLLNMKMKIITDYNMVKKY